MKKIIEETAQNYHMQFMKFIAKYDLFDWSIYRKFMHSLSVAEQSFLIACKLNLNAREREIAYVIGLLHDVGRFEQWKKYHTFSDYKSVDHADLSVKLILDGAFDLSNFSNDEQKIILTAIKCHTKEYTGKNKKIKLFNTIIMSADAYSNVILSAEGAHVLFSENCGYTESLVNDFINLKPIYTYKIENKIDRILSLLALTYYSRYDFLRNEILKTNMIDIILNNYLHFLNEEEQKFIISVVKKFKKNYKNKNFNCQFFINTNSK